MKEQKDWLVVYTKSKWEKKVAERLAILGITAYCPLQTVVRQWSDRQKKVQAPLFASYVFVQLEEKNRADVFAVPGVVRYLFWLGKPAVVRDSEIQTIKEWLQEPNTLALEVAAWQVGDTVTLDSGPFSQQQARVREVTNNSYVLYLEALGCTLRIRK